MDRAPWFGRDECACRRRDRGARDRPSRRPVDEATVVSFDAGNDVAILRAPAKGRALPLGLIPSGERRLRSSGSRSTGHVVTPARVGGTARVAARDAYGRVNVGRTVVGFRGEVNSGNSGGPVVDRNGSVVATVFARRRGLDRRIRCAERRRAERARERRPPARDCLRRALSPLGSQSEGTIRAIGSGRGDPRATSPGSTPAAGAGSHEQLGQRDDERTLLRRREPVARRADVGRPIDQLGVRPLVGRMRTPGLLELLELRRDRGERAAVAHPAVVVPRETRCCAGRLREALDERPPRRLPAECQCLDHLRRHGEVDPRPRRARRGRGRCGRDSPADPRHARRRRGSDRPQDRGGKRRGRPRRDGPRGVPEPAPHSRSAAGVRRGQSDVLFLVVDCAGDLGGTVVGRSRTSAASAGARRRGGREVAADPAVREPAARVPPSRGSCRARRSASGRRSRPSAVILPCQSRRASAPPGLRSRLMSRASRAARR